jgi:hypothetical protein
MPSICVGLVDSTLFTICEVALGWSIRTASVRPMSKLE